MGLYRGVWPQNVSKLAKYAVRFVDGQWRVTVLYDAGDGLRFLAVEDDGEALISLVNGIKTKHANQPGGAFYLNEYGHVVVPVVDSALQGETVYYCAGKYQTDLRFDFEGKPLSSRAVDADGNAISPGGSWTGPRPGIPYVLAAGGNDIYFESPALTDEDPPALRPRVTRKVQLSRMLNDRTLLQKAVEPIARVRGYAGGRFYVNEHGAMFTPVTSGDGNGIDYTFCGHVDLGAWFPEPPL